MDEANIQQFVNVINFYKKVTNGRSQILDSALSWVGGATLNSTPNSLQPKVLLKDGNLSFFLCRRRKFFTHRKKTKREPCWSHTFPEHNLYCFFLTGLNTEEVYILTRWNTVMFLTERRNELRKRLQKWINALIEVQHTDVLCRDNKFN